MGCSGGRVVPVAPAFDNISSLQDDLEAKLAAQIRVGGAHGTDEGQNAIPKCDSQVVSPDDTIIIFDWDDTLCPSSWTMRHDVTNNNLRHPGLRYEEDLEKLTSVVVNLLTLAKSAGKVVIVTNSSPGWVQHCCATIMPQATSILKDIPIYHGRQFISAVEQAGMTQDVSFAEAKVRGIRTAISCFYSGQSWKNVLSIGDANAEREAVRKVVDARSNKAQPCLTKSVKLFKRPDLDRLNMQLSVVSCWLTRIVQADHDLDIVFSQ